MANADLLKGGVIVVVLLAALAAFDAYSNYSYAGNQATGAAVLRGGGGGSGVAGVSIDLSNYPAFFIKNGIFDAVIVVGDQASSAHVLAAADIAYSLVSFGATSATKLASEVADTFAQNVISIGTGCVNAVTNNIQVRFGQISGGGGRCWNGALSGEGVGAITLYDFGNGKVGMVVEGYTDNDVRRAAKVLVSYKDWQASGYLVGKGILVEATSQGGTKLSGYGWTIATDETACTDSDGENYYAKGSVTEGEDNFVDYCRTDNILREYGCFKEISGITVGSMLEYRCLSGCKDGACVPNCILEEGKATCVVEEGQSPSVSVGGKTYEISADFVGSTWAILTVNGEVTPSLMAGKSVVLADGATLKVLKLTIDNSAGGKRLVEFAINQGACTDSDGGKDYNVRGKITGLAPETGLYGEDEDVCRDDLQLDEGYCEYSEHRGTTTRRIDVFTCPDGCKDGACLQSNQAAAAVKDILNDGETRTYTINEKDYEVTADSVGSTEVVFSVNGELTHFKELQADGTYKKRGLMVGEMYGLTVYGLATGGQTGGGIAIRVDKIETQDFAGGYRRVTFAIFASSQAVGPVVVNTLTLKANSFAVIALGAAFGSYYDANAVSTRSTCNPDDIFLASWVYAPTTEYDEETGEQYESAYQNVMLFDVDSDSRLAVKPKGHDYALRRLKFSEKGLATFNWSEAAGAWILNEGPECTLALAYDQEKMWENVQTVYAQPRLAKGINFVSVVPQMIGKTMEDVKGDCDLTGAYSNFGHSVPSASDALTKRSWDWWTPKHTFTQNELGLGMWLYSDNTCRLDFS